MLRLTPLLIDVTANQFARGQEHSTGTPKRSRKQQTGGKRDRRRTEPVALAKHQQ